MKPIKKILMIIVFPAIFVACNNNNNAPKEDNKKTAEEMNDAKFNHEGEKDAEFVTDVQDINLTEMNLGQLAASKAMMTETKDLGKMMETSHKKAYDDLASLAAKKTISVPSAMSDASKKDYDNLSQKTGVDFDKDFCDMMVKGHKDAIDKFEKGTKDLSDPDLQAWASNMLPALRAHLDNAMKCQEMLKGK
jgi:putative membrane protein